MTGTSIAPRRVLRELTREDELDLGLERARDIRDKAIARAKADYVQRVIELVESSKAERAPPPENGDQPQNGDGPALQTSEPVVATPPVVEEAKPSVQASGKKK